MKKLFFCMTCVICFVYTYTQLSADPSVSGVMNAPFNAQVDRENHLYDFHPGYDVYWNFDDQTVAPVNTLRPKWAENKAITKPIFLPT